MSKSLHSPTTPSQQEIEMLSDKIIREHEAEMRSATQQQSSSQYSDQDQFEYLEDENHTFSQFPIQKQSPTAAVAAATTAANESQNTYYSKGLSELKALHDHDDLPKKLNNHHLNYQNHSQANELDLIQFSTFSNKQMPFNQQSTQNSNPNSVNRVITRTSGIQYANQQQAFTSNLPLTNRSDFKGYSAGQFGDFNDEIKGEDEVEQLKAYIRELEQELKFIKPAVKRCEELWAELGASREREADLSATLKDCESQHEIISRQQSVQIVELQRQISRLQENNDGWKCQIEKERSEKQELLTQRERSEENLLTKNKYEETLDNSKYRDLYLKLYEEHQEQSLYSQQRIFSLEQEIQSLSGQVKRIRSESNLHEITLKNDQISQLEDFLRQKDEQIIAIDNAFQIAKQQLANFELGEKYIEDKEALFDEMANKVCVFVNDLRKSAIYDSLLVEGHLVPAFKAQITNHDVEYIEYEQLFAFLEASLSQLEAFISQPLNIQELSKRKGDDFFNGEELIQQLQRENAELRRQRSEFQPYALHSYQVDEMMKKNEIFSLQKLELEVKNKQHQEIVSLLKGELERIHAVYAKKTEKRRVYFEKCIEWLSKAIQSKSVNEICEDILMNLKDIDGKKCVKISVSKKLSEIEAELKSNLTKSSQRELDPLRKFLSQKQAEKEDIVKKIKNVQEKLWNLQEKLKEQCLLERRGKEDLIDCERAYLKLRLNQEHLMKQTNNHERSLKPPQSSSSTKNIIQQKEQRTLSFKTQSGNDNHQFSQHDNDLILHIISNQQSQNHLQSIKAFRSISNSSSSQQQQQQQLTTFPPKPVAMTQTHIKQQSGIPPDQQRTITQKQREQQQQQQQQKQGSNFFASENVYVENDPNKANTFIQESSQQENGSLAVQRQQNRDSFNSLKDKLEQHKKTLSVPKRR